MIRAINTNEWYMLSGLTDSHGKIIQLTAAASSDGIPVIARWQKVEEGWHVTALDGESQEWEVVKHFTEEEFVPPEPPECENVVMEKRIRQLEANIVCLANGDIINEDILDNNCAIVQSYIKYLKRNQK
jgi:hypothetical protein